MKQPVALLLLFALLLAFAAARWSASASGDVIMYDVTCWQNGAMIFHGEVNSNNIRPQSEMTVVLPPIGCVWIEKWRKSARPVVPTRTSVPDEHIRG